MLKISIVTPTFNSAKSISDNVKSILNQTYQNFEHIIIDNKSEDATLPIIIESYATAMLKDKVIICSERDKGISDAFNRGIDKSTGDIVGILNSDDYYYSLTILEKIENIFREDPTIDFIHGDMLFVDPEFGTNLRRPLHCSVEYAMPFNHPSMFFRKTVYNELGLFNLGYRYCMDFDFICRVLAKNKNGFYLPETITVMNAGGASDVNERKVLEEYKLILEMNNMFSKNALNYYEQKKIRIKVKRLIHLSGMKILIKLWRNYKWN